MPGHGSLKLWIALIGMAVASPICATPLGGIVAGNAFVALTQQPAPLHKGDTAIGLLAASQPMHIAVSLRLRNRVALESFLATAQQTGTPVAQRTMSPADFAAQFAPTQAQAQAVANYLASAGFVNVSIAANRQLVSADATADTVHAAFHTGLVHVSTHDGRDAYANTGDVMIPAPLRQTVLAVLGLQTVNVFRVSARPASGNVVHPSSVPGFTGHYPTEFATIYGGSGVPTASTIPVGIIAEGSMSAVLSDLQAFTAAHHLPAVSTQVVGSGSSDTTSDDEWDIDSQDIVGISGGVNKLVFYSAPSMHNSDIAADINAAVTANATKIVNVSLDECEEDARSDGMVAAVDQILEQAVAQGQTFSISTGDHGTQECAGNGPYPTVSVSYPASSPYAVAVGGTTLAYTDGSYYPGESVWEDSPTKATGGGPSAFEPMPAWQVGVGRNAGQTTRGLPDVAFDGNPDTGAVIILHGKQVQYGGTSLSAPLFAGAWARMLAAKGAGFGFAAPRLYQLPADAFHDVTSGQNIGEQAYPGWDYASGFGSLNMGQTLTDFSAPVASFKYATAGSTVNFTDTSVDWGGTLSRHSWYFGDGTTSTATNPTHAYAVVGYYQVTETVTDGATGKTGSVMQTVYAIGAPPVVDFSYLPNGIVPGTLDFYDKSRDPNNLGVEINWYFGDGGHGVSIGLDSKVTHTYAAGGTYNVTEVVTDAFVGGPSGSRTKSVTVMPVTAPSLKLPVSSDGGYTVNWAGVPSATSYVLQQRFGGQAWVTVQNSTATSWFSISDLGPHASGAYGYQVHACNAGGCGPWSPVGTIAVNLGTTVSMPAAAPALAVPATDSTGNYTITWTSVTGATGYKLQQQAAGGPWTSTGHVFSNALVARGKPDGAYTYRVQACNPSGCGSWSNEATIVVTLP